MGTQRSSYPQREHAVVEQLCSQPITSKLRVELAHQATRTSNKLIPLVKMISSLVALEVISSSNSTTLPIQAKQIILALNPSMCLAEMVRMEMGTQALEAEW